ncbi:SusC/RagA family TonB-linked outer membrane protein [Pedobacter cryophilus]|uniref:TonB-dependent receptor n=1 Tax=Pedobacter cryophilus TaxID=2571271 RepID=A0A4U1BYY4_9SPHI|nr:TonB-dependent receptor [Pedobacter cryophilus]TKB96893.1 TonB-dependent receptor [Pedobacter cryophilus]
MKQFYKASLFVLLSLFFCYQNSNAQDLNISGIVRDQIDKTPLIGVSIYIKNGNKATTSDIDGKFKLVGIKKSDIIMLSYLGFKTQTISSSNFTNGFLDIYLTIDQESLDEVIVVGYGDKKISEISGAVARVSMEEILLAPVVSFEDALAGRVAGVQVSSNDGQPGEAPNIVIRGPSSVTQSNSPLYVVDGFPLEESNNNTINPADIESITVLKDASSTSQYGSRGANGVILITTKSGKIGAPTISYDVNAGVQENLKFQKMLSPYEFVKYQFELNPSITASQYFTGGQTLESFRDVDGFDFQQPLLRDALFLNHNLSVRGGTEKTKYSISGSLTGQDGLIINSGFNRQQGRLRLDQNINNKLKLALNSNYSATKTYGTFVAQANNTSPSENLMYSVWGYRPITGNINDTQFFEELFDEAVDPAAELRINPIINVKNALRENRNSVFTNNLYLTYDFNSNLSLKVSGGATLTNSQSDVFNNSNTRSGSRFSATGVGVNGSVINRTNKNLLNENILTYKKLFSKVHKVTLIGGVNYQKVVYSSFGASAILLPNETLGSSGLDEGTAQTITSTSSQYSLASYLGSGSYAYKSKYFFDAGFRTDGSSRFSEGKKWSVFPSAAFAWNLGSEKFMQALKIVNSAKLRSSYGITGNNRVNDFAYQSTLVINNGTGYSFGNQPQIGIITSAFGNDNLKWESTAQFDIGLDIEILKKRVALTVDYYEKRTSDLLLNATIPPSSGFTSAFINVGKVSNYGLEFALNTVNVKSKNFTWTSSFNISFNRNRLLELYSNQTSLQNNVNWDSNYGGAAPYISVVGQPISSIYGYIWDGNYQYDDFDLLPNGTYLLKANIPTNGNPRASIQPGFVKYRDINGDGVVNNADRTVIGRPYPIHNGGFSNNFRYLGFDLNIFFQWSYGNDLFNANRIVFEGGNRRYNLNQFDTYKNRWSPTNQTNELNAAGGSGPFVYSSRTVEDGSYLRLKTAAIGYTFNKKLFSKLGLKSLRVFASGQNLFTWTNYSGLDPEVSTRNSVRTPGFDFSAYPRARTITAGLNVSL